MNDAPQATHLADYEAPNFSVERVELAFNLHEEDTIVRAALSLQRQASGPLVLDGEDLALESIFIDNNALPSDAYTVSPSSLTIPDVLTNSPYVRMSAFSRRTTPSWRGCINPAVTSAPNAKRRGFGGSPIFWTART